MALIPTHCAHCSQPLLRDDAEHGIKHGTYCNWYSRTPGRQTRCRRCKQELAGDERYIAPTDVCNRCIGVPAATY